MVSIIVPVYKVPEYLNRCVESIRNQTYTDLEIILVDDGSPDECPQICDKLAKEDERIIVVHQKNRGLSAARNTGLKRSTGEYILYVDSDDYIKDDMIDTLVSAVEEFGADIAVSTYFFSSGDNKDLLRLSGRILSGKTEDIIKIIYSNGLWQAWAKLIKREIAVACPFIEGLIYEDYENTPRLLAHAEQVVVMMDGRYIYTVRDNSIMGERKKITEVDFAKITNDTLELYEKQDYKKEVKNYIFSFLIKQLVYNYHITMRNDNSKYNAFLCATRKVIKKHKKKWISNKSVGFGRKLSYITIMYFPGLYRKMYLIIHKEKKNER